MIQATTRRGPRPSDGAGVPDPQRPTHLVVVAGTTTDIGKTWVTARLLEDWRERGWTVAARKPVQSFAAGDDPRFHDSAILAEASQEPDTAVCPEHRRYAAALAPPMAADALGLDPIGVAELAEEVSGSWSPRRVDIGVVELAGGPRSPVAHDGDGIGLTTALGPDTVVLVADSSLGTLNAVRLCIDPLRATTSAVTIVHLNRFDESSSLHRANRDWLTDHDHLAVTTSVAGLARLITASVESFCVHCGRRSLDCDGRCSRPYDPDRYCPRCGRRMAVTITPIDSVARCRIHGEP